MGTPLIAVQGYSAPKTGAAFSRARILCERLGEAEPLVAALSGEFVYHFVRGHYPTMRRLTDEAREVSERLPDPVIRLAAHRLGRDHGHAFRARLTRHAPSSRRSCAFMRRADIDLSRFTTFTTRKFLP